MLPAAPPEVEKTQTPVKHIHGGSLNDWYQDADGEWCLIKPPTQEHVEMDRTYANDSRYKPVPQYTAPTTHYISTAKFKYPSWRRVEDKRTVYSMSGIEIASAKKYIIELTKPLQTYEEERDACLELLHATVEFGMLAAEPSNERWVDSENEHIILLQNLRIELHNLFVEHKIIDHDEFKERKFIWDYLNTNSDNVNKSLALIEELVKEYQYGMFDPEKKTKKYSYGANVKKKKKKLAKSNKSGKVKR